MNVVRNRNRQGRRIARMGTLAVIGIPLLGLLGPVAPAQAAGSDAAYAFGAEILAGGQDVVPPTPEAAVASPPGDATKTLVDVPASPVAVSGTLIATANAHAQPDLTSALTVVTQAVPGPFDARAVGQIENAAVVYQGQTPLLSASVIRAEAVAVCSPTPTFAANSEIIDLSVAGNQVPVNAPVQDLIDGITSALQQSGLNAVVDVHRNVVTDLPGGGKSVDALVVSVLDAAGNTPVAEVRLAHAEVTTAACTGGTAANKPQCSDGADNDGDSKIDAADPGCHTDGDASHPATYNPNDDDERNAATATKATPLARTGGDYRDAVLGAGLLSLGLAGFGLRRRLGF